MLKLSKERKVYAALLGLGLTALAADKFLFSPAGAGAATIAQAQLEAAPEPLKYERAAPLAPAASKGPGLQERLEKAAVTGPPVAGDAFTPPDGWIRRPSTQSEEPAAPAPDDFAREHRVRLIVWGQSPDGSDATVFVGPHPVRVGETLDGYTLRRIEQRPRRAVFESTDHRAVELVIAETQTSRPPAGHGR